MTLSGLVRLNEALEPEPDWAHSWEPLEDGAGWRFRIRVNTDGWGEAVPVTAHDFAEHWMALLDPESELPGAALLADIENADAYRRGEVGASEVGIDAPSDWILDIFLERFRETFPVVTASLPLRPPRPANANQVDDCQQNGGFREVGRTDFVLSLTTSENYWNLDGSELERIDLSIYSSGIALTEFGQAELDLMRLTGADVLRVRDDDSFSDAISEAQPQRVIMLVPNLEIPPFDRVEVRRALSLVVDRRRLELIVEGRVIPATRLLPPGMFSAFDDAAAGITADFDVDAAYEELRNTPYGSADEWPAIGIDIPATDGYLDRIARDVANQIRENLGIPVPIRVHDPAEYAEGLRERRYPLAWFDWSYPYADPASVYTELFASWRDFDRPVSWVDQEYDELLLAADTLSSSESRASAWAGCEGLLQERGACIPLVHPIDHYLVQPWLDGLPRDGRRRLIAGQLFGLDPMRRVRVLERAETS